MTAPDPFEFVDWVVEALAEAEALPVAESPAEEAAPAPVAPSVV